MTLRAKTPDPPRRRQPARRPSGAPVPEPEPEPRRIPDIEELPDGFGQRRKRD